MMDAHGPTTAQSKRFAEWENSLSSRRLQHTVGRGARRQTKQERLASIRQARTSRTNQRTIMLNAPSTNLAPRSTAHHRKWLKLTERHMLGVDKRCQDCIRLHEHIQLCIRCTQRNSAAKLKERNLRRERMDRLSKRNRHHARSNISNEPFSIDNALAAVGSLVRDKPSSQIVRHSLFPKPCESKTELPNTSICNHSHTLKPKSESPLFPNGTGPAKSQKGPLRVLPTSTLLPQPPARENTIPAYLAAPVIQSPDKQAEPKDTVSTSENESATTQIADRNADETLKAHPSPELGGQIAPVWLAAAAKPSSHSTQSPQAPANELFSDGISLKRKRTKDHCKKGPSSEHQRKKHKRDQAVVAVKQAIDPIWKAQTINRAQYKQISRDAVHSLMRVRRPWPPDLAPQFVRDKVANLKPKCNVIDATPSAASESQAMG